jgi:hypothetical protein
MRNFTAVVVCLLAVTGGSCRQTPSATRNTRSCPPMFRLADMQPLACWIDDNYLLEIGNASATAIPAGTSVSFVAKLVNAGAYCSAVRTTEPIPPHLGIVITGQPLFDNQATCQAWREVPPVVKQ